MLRPLRSLVTALAVAASLAPAMVRAAAQAPGAAGLPSERIREAAAAVLADQALQHALPVAPPPPDLWLPPEPLVLLVRLLLYAGLAVLAVLAAAWLVRRLAPAPRDAAAVAEERAAHAPVAIPVAGARALAAEGRHGEAIHALLLDTLAALSRAARLAPSLTSREIVARVALPLRAREALIGLVVAVELSRFGGDVPGEAEYLACLARFEAFVASYRGRTP